MLFVLLIFFFSEITTFLGYDLRKSRNAAQNRADFQKEVITCRAIPEMTAFSLFWQKICFDKKHF